MTRGSAGVDARPAARPDERSAARPAARPAGRPSEQADDQLRRLVDQADLRDLVDRYLRSLDVRGFDEVWAATHFTDDVVLTFPVGSHRGIAGVVEFTDTIMRRWPTTLHHGTNCTAAVSGDHAQVSWNLLASHVHPGSPPPPAPSEVFHIGGVFTAVAVRTAEGWRFRQLNLRIVWTAGRAATGIPPVSADPAA